MPRAEEPKVPEGHIRVHVPCPFCDHVEELICPEDAFDVERFHAKQRAGCHLVAAHPERIYEMAVVLAGPLQGFVQARIDGARKEARSLTELQNATNPLKLSR